MSDVADRVCDAIRELANYSAAELAEGIKDACSIAQAEIGGLESEISDLEEKIESSDDEGGDHEDAINAFLDEVERPVGTMSYAVPNNDRVNRAIIGLHDAIGRNI